MKMDLVAIYDAFPVSMRAKKISNVRWQGSHGVICVGMDADRMELITGDIQITTKTTDQTTS